MEDRSISELSENRYGSDLKVECYMDNNISLNYKMLHLV